MQSQLLEENIQETSNIHGELTKVNSRLNHLEDMVNDILESGREMDENLTSQLDDVRYEIALQHETIKKLKRSSCTRTHKLLGLFVATFGTWILFLWSV